MDKGYVRLLLKALTQLCTKGWACQSELHPGPHMVIKKSQQGEELLPNNTDKGEPWYCLGWCNGLELMCKMYDCDFKLNFCYIYK